MKNTTCLLDRFEKRLAHWDPVAMLEPTLRNGGPLPKRSAGPTAYFLFLVFSSRSPSVGNGMLECSVCVSCIRFFLIVSP